MKLSQLITIIALLTLLIPQAYSLFHASSQKISYRMTPPDSGFREQSFRQPGDLQ